MQKKDKLKRQAYPHFTLNVPKINDFSARSRCQSMAEVLEAMRSYANAEDSIKIAQVLEAVSRSAIILQYRMASSVSDHGLGRSRSTDGSLQKISISPQPRRWQRLRRRKSYKAAALCLVPLETRG